MQLRHKPYEGLFITLEGGDGCGKSTLSALLSKELAKKGYPVLKTREPGGTPLSEHLRDVVLKPDPNRPVGERAELLLFLAARVQHIDEVILPALRDRKLLICERFNDSTIAYQGCRKHVGVHVAEQICDLACNHLVPDLTLLLDLDPIIGLQRLSKERKNLDRLEQEELQFHIEVRTAYLHLADKYPERIIIIDGSATPEEVCAASLKALEPHLMLKPTSLS